MARVSLVDNRTSLVALGAAVIVVAWGVTACGAAPAPDTPVPVHPSATVLDVAGVEDDVTMVLDKDYGERATNVECPGDEPVVVGEAFTCTVSVGGRIEHVQITVKSPGGKFEVGAPR